MLTTGSTTSVAFRPRQSRATSLSRVVMTIPICYKPHVVLGIHQGSGPSKGFWLWGQGFVAFAHSKAACRPYWVYCLTRSLIVSGGKHEATSQAPFTGARHRYLGGRQR